MFYSDRISHDDHTAIAAVLDIPHLLRHRHSVDSFFEDYQRQAGIASARKLTGLREFTPYLLDFISDEKTIYAAFNHMQAKGSHAPGPDGLRYEDIESSDVWSWCRLHRDAIRAGQYARSTERVQKISKGPGRGFRELTIQSVEDRIIQRAIVEILQPLLNPLFDPRSFGYRPKKGPLRALAHAESIHRKSGRGVWVSLDIENAFPNVPVDRLLTVLRKYFDDDELMAFLTTIIQPDKTSGSGKPSLAVVAEPVPAPHPRPAMAAVTSQDPATPVRRRHSAALPDPPHSAFGVSGVGGPVTTGRVHTQGERVRRDPPPRERRSGAVDGLRDCRRKRWPRILCDGPGMGETGRDAGSGPRKAARPDPGVPEPGCLGQP